MKSLDICSFLGLSILIALVALFMLTSWQFYSNLTEIDKTGRAMAEGGPA
ncbi:MAG: hypothetical protein RR100_03460 [Comamonas sp.]